MIRSRQRQGRGDPQPASAAIMDGVWTGRWDPTKNSGSGSGSDNSGERGQTRSRSGSGDNPRCAVCLEEIGAAAASGSDDTGFGGGDGEEFKGLVAAGPSDWTADIGSAEAGLAGAETAHSKGSFAYLPCGHRFHTHW